LRDALVSQLFVFPLLSLLSVMRLGNILKKNQRLKALEEDDPEYGHSK
jgi:hypothetical protein